MAYNESDAVPTQVKILIAGGFGVGKTTFVSAASEIEPLSTEELITAASVGVDSLSGIEEKTTTTVALDFGRITIDDNTDGALPFGTPGQERFWFMWDELSAGHWAPSCLPTPVACRHVSMPWTSSSAGHRFWSPSTNSTVRSATNQKRCEPPSNSTLACRS